MKKFLVLSLLTVQLVAAQNGIRFNKTEFFTLSTSIDPTNSIQEKGLDIVAEIEYSGFIYAKVGFESFSALSSGFRDVHGAMGINLTTGLFEKTRFYSGIRLAKVYCGPIYGIEGGIDFNLSDKFFIGVRATFDKRYDQEVFRWEKELKGSGFIRFGYKWSYKK